MKSIFMLFLIIFVLQSCGENKPSDTNDVNTASQTETNTSGTTTEATEPTDNNTATPTTNSTVKGSYVTDAIIKQVCDCVKNAKGAEKSERVASVKSCMGADGSYAYMANVLGSGADDKQIGDAATELQNRIASDCPIN